MRVRNVDGPSGWAAARNRDRFRRDRAVAAARGHRRDRGRAGARRDDIADGVRRKAARRRNSGPLTFTAHARRCRREPCPQRARYQGISLCTGVDVEVAYSAGGGNRRCHRTHSEHRCGHFAGALEGELRTTPTATRSPARGRRERARRLRRWPRIARTFRPLSNPRRSLSIRTCAQLDVGLWTQPRPAHAGRMSQCDSRFAHLFCVAGDVLVGVTGCYGWLRS